MGNNSSKILTQETPQSKKINDYIIKKPYLKTNDIELLKIYFRKWNIEQLYLKIICKKRYNLFNKYFNYWLKKTNNCECMTKYFYNWYSNVFSNKYNLYKIKKQFKYWKYVTKEKKPLYEFNLLQKKKKYLIYLKIINQ